MTEKKSRALVHYCEGMNYYGSRCIRMGFGPFDPRSKEPCLFLGVYFKEDLDDLLAYKGDRFVFWNGNDVSRLLKNKDWQERIGLAGGSIKHGCHHDGLYEELKSVGIEAEVSPTFFGNPRDYPVSFRPSKNPEFFMHVPSGREEEYGLTSAIEIFSRLRCDFFPNYGRCSLHLYGTGAIGGRVQAGDNIFFHGWVPEWRMDAETDKMQGCVRMNRHDGTSQIVIKAILRGQYPILGQDKWSVFCQVSDVIQATEPSNLSEILAGLNEFVNSVLTAGGLDQI